MSLKASVKFIDHTNDALTGIGKAINTAVQKSLAVMERNIKANTPIRHGTLARSITSKMLNPLEGQVDTSQVAGGKEVNYAIFVEYGTRYMAPRAMFRKGVAQSEARIQQIFDEELSKKVV
jgi:HK97 gp10 family phage protein